MRNFASKFYCIIWSFRSSTNANSSRRNFIFLLPLNCQMCQDEKKKWNNNNYNQFCTISFCEFTSSIVLLLHISSSVLRQCVCVCVLCVAIIIGIVLLQLLAMFWGVWISSQATWTGKSMAPKKKKKNFLFVHWNGSIFLDKLQLECYQLIF